MYPFVHILGLSIPSYGIMTALAYAAGLYYCYKQRAKLGLDKDMIFDLVFWVIIGALIGGKIFFIWFNFDSFVTSSLIEKIRYGFVFYGGLIGGFVAGYIWLKKYKKPILPVLDFFAIPLALGHAIGRIGCFLAGCCYGKISHNLLSVKYTDPKSLVPEHLHNVGLYPVQLMESFAILILFFILLYCYQRPHKKGVIFAGYLLGYCVIRFVLEYFRFDDRGGGLFGLSPSQIIAIILLVISAFLFKRKEK